MLKLEVSGLRQSQQFLHELPTFTDVIAQRIAIKAATAAAGDLKGKSPANTGNLAQSHKAIKTAKGALVLVDTNYGQIVHDGRKANSQFPPLSAIQDWVRTKGIDPKYTYAIWYKIKIKGTRKQPWVRDYANSSDFQKRINQAVQIELKRDLENG